MATIFGTSGNDSWTVVGPGTVVVDALAGYDTLFLGTSLRSAYTITQTSDGAVHVDSISNASGGVFHATLYNFEELDFNNGKDKLILSTYFTKPPNVINGTSGDDVLIGTAAVDNISGLAGNDTITGGAGNDTINGGSGVDTAVYSGNLSNYKVSHSGSTYSVVAKTGTDGTDTLTSIESLKFADMTVNLSIQSVAANAPHADVQRLMELYVAFFNRVPDADGLAYWIGQMQAGHTISQIADSFYDAGVQSSALTGFSSTMSNADFVNVVYKNVLGRADGADPEGLAYWSGELANGHATKGSLVSNILDSAHSFKGDATYGWVADLLDNKIVVAKTFAIDLGLGYVTDQDAIQHGMQIAAAVTPTSTAAAINLIGIAPADLSLL
jgi:Ca2+-binding RTX toxin-like protein